MIKIAIFPGSFDPITKGHEDLILRIAPLFDKLYIAIGHNSNKKTLFPLETRMEWIRQCFSRHAHIEVAAYDGLTVDFCKKINARYIIRGIRNSIDFLYEQDIALANHHLSSEIETLFISSSPLFSYISSSVVRDVYINKGDYQSFMPDCIKIDDYI